MLTVSLTVKCSLFWHLSSPKPQELTFSQRWLGGTTSLPGYLCKVQPCARSKSQTQQIQKNVELDKIENTFLTNCKCFSSRCKGPMFKTHCSFLLPNTASAHLIIKNLGANTVPFYITTVHWNWFSPALSNHLTKRVLRSWPINSPQFCIFLPL